MVVVAHQDETDPSICEYADISAWIRLGQLGALIKHLRENGISQAIMAGTITKRRMFYGVRPDLKGLALMARIKIFHDDTILRGVADELKRYGIEIVPSTFLLPQLLAEEGVFTRKTPSRSQEEDIELGLRMAKEIGRLDIGQTIVVKDRVVVAVEAIEGTDETIRRGGHLAPGAVVVKVSKPNQDLRFDLPTVGPKTIQVMAEANLAGLCIEANRTIIIDKDEMISLANKKGIFVVSRGF